MRKDWKTLELCDRFFDSIERKDFDAVETCYAPEAVVWHSHDCLYQPRADNLDMLQAGMRRRRRSATRTAASACSRAASCSSTPSR